MDCCLCDLTTEDMYHCSECEEYLTPLRLWMVERTENNAWGLSTAILRDMHPEWLNLVEGFIAGAELPFEFYDGRLLRKDEF